MEDTKKLLGAVTISPKIIEEVEAQVKNIEGFKNKIKEDLSENVTDLLDVVLYGAITLDASDVHIEHMKDNVRIRYRRKIIGRSTGIAVACCILNSACGKRHKVVSAIA